MNTNITWAEEKKQNIPIQLGTVAFNSLDDILWFIASSPVS